MDPNAKAQALKDAATKAAKPVVAKKIPALAQPTVPIPIEIRQATVQWLMTDKDGASFARVVVDEFLVPTLKKAGKIPADLVIDRTRRAGGGVSKAALKAKDTKIVELEEMIKKLQAAKK